MKQLFFTLFLLFAGMSMAFAQRTVSGKVTDNAGEPVIGANIIVKEAPGVGSITDIDGMYQLSIPDAGKTLEFSYTGFEGQELAIGNASTINVTMSEGKLLEEVVVTALGIKRDKKSLGYAVTDIGSDQVLQRAETDPIRALSGKVAGVNITGAGGAPGQSTKINIRGFSSLNGNPQPLFVVAGIPFDNKVASSGQATQFSNRAFDIDPNNIESVSVLKETAAAALYGSRAERPAVAKVTITGNSDISTEDLKKALTGVGLAEGRVFDRSLLDKVEQELLRQYYSRGRYAVQIKSQVRPLQRNRVAVTLDISEGAVASIRQITVVGNKAFTEKELLSPLQSSTGGWFSFFTNDDQYAKQKLGADIETLRSFYLDRGYLKFNVHSTQVSITPDKKDGFTSPSILPKANFIPFRTCN